RAFTAFTAWACAIEDGEVLGLQARRSFERHRAANMLVRGLDCGFRTADRAQKVEAWRVHLLRGQPKGRCAESLAKRPFIEAEFDVERAGKARLNGRNFLVREAFCRKRFMIDVRRVLKCAAPNGIGHDRSNGGLGVAKRP